MTSERFLLRLLRMERRRLLLGTAIGLVTAVATVGLMAVGGGLLTLCAVSGLVSSGSWNPAVGRLSAAIRFFAVLRTVGRYGERVATHEATFRLLAGLRRRFFSALAPRLDVTARSSRAGDLLQRLVADVDALAGFYIRVLSPLSWAVGLVALLAILLLVFDWRTAGVAVAQRNPAIREMTTRLLLEPCTATPPHSYRRANRLPLTACRS